jgi:hypothetical protein
MWVSVKLCTFELGVIVCVCVCVSWPPVTRGVTVKCVIPIASNPPQ